MGIIIISSIYSIVGLSITYALKTRSFLEFTMLCIRENVNRDNLYLNTNEFVKAGADKLLKYSDMFESFKIITYLVMIGSLLFGLSKLLTQWG